MKKPELTATYRALASQLESTCRSPGIGLALLVGDVLHQLREVALLDGAHGDVLGNHAHPPAVLAAKKVMALPSGGPRPS